jgi:2-oxoglutarate ferredoxin oxidoreductase subunit beta
MLLAFSRRASANQLICKARYQPLPDFYKRLTPRRRLERTCVEEVRKYDVTEYWRELV